MRSLYSISPLVHTVRYRLRYAQQVDEDGRVYLDFALSAGVAFARLRHVALGEISIALEC